jgi:glycosyltransferase involved in cell wall biosynthesis
LKSERITIIYANRNRDIKRIKASLDTLNRQSYQNFEVVFVDYGSNPNLVRELRELLADYGFLKFFSLEVSQLLWNKSKALNFGIKQANFPYIFIADVDLIFHPDTTKVFNNLVDEEKFFLFNLGYLDKAESKKIYESTDFMTLSPSRFGEVNGMILAPTKAFYRVNGLDEFFHFYGSEDEDLFSRMANAGYKREDYPTVYFNHNWHQSFAGSEDKIITRNPRVKNIMRINQRHFLRNREKGIIKPCRQAEMGNVISRKESDLLQKPTKLVKIYNILSHVEHFLGEELPSYTGEIIRVEFIEDPYIYSLKYKIKKLLGKQTQPYCSLKEVNDIVLKEIVFNYRDANYSYKISENFKSIIFCIRL